MNEKGHCFKSSSLPLSPKVNDVTWLIFCHVYYLSQEPPPPEDIPPQENEFPERIPESPCVDDYLEGDGAAAAQQEKLPLRDITNEFGVWSPSLIIDISEEDMLRVFPLSEFILLTWSVA
jgi:hypothetical protein